MSDPAPEAKKPRVGRGLKIALALSLSLNLLIIGLIGGAITAGGGLRGGDDGRGPGLRALGLGPFALSLDREDRADLRTRLEGGDLGAPRRAIGGAMRDLQAALRSDPFDRDAAGAALARSRGAAEALQSEGHTALLDMLETMPAADRAQLAQRLDRVLRRMGRSEGPSR
ncbi:MAG: periplasmic heavy metal sensor [Pseudomonadota bacterium]